MFVLMPYVLFVKPFSVAKKFGGIAQLGERYPYKVDVVGSSPIVPTI